MEFAAFHIFHVLASQSILMSKFNVYMCLNMSRDDFLFAYNACAAFYINPCVYKYEMGIVFENVVFT